MTVTPRPAIEETNALELLYAGWREYRKNIKGWYSTPSLVDITDWEQYKQLIFAGIDARRRLDADMP